METVKYECKDCNKSFESKRELDDHNERNHGGIGNSENRQRNKDSKMDDKIEKREGKRDNDLRDERNKTDNKIRDRDAKEQGK
ncbi:MAG: hypothetical protein M1431_01990 [Candidatus Thermoplasmatota archaeon]|nr:hypothetical protein [Candidatus Thermoplasmatota archaeon]